MLRSIRSSSRVRLACRSCAGALLVLISYVISSAMFQRGIFEAQFSEDAGEQVSEDVLTQLIYDSDSSRWVPPLASYYAPLEWLSEKTLLGGPLEAFWQGSLDVHDWIYLPDQATPYQTHGGVI